MSVRELLENSLDAAEMAGTLPEVYLRIIPEGPDPNLSDPKPYRLSVTDNGPGVSPQHVPSAFGKVFYGSKYVLRQSRGMFGLGGTMAILYGQITTNKPVTVSTSADGKWKHEFQMIIDIGENRPTVLKRLRTNADGTTGTRVDLTLEGDYPRAAQKIRLPWSPAMRTSPSSTPRVKSLSTRGPQLRCPSLLRRLSRIPTVSTSRRSNGS
jgi:DNA topoisomerase-6 subunit B